MNRYRDDKEPWTGFNSAVVHRCWTISEKCTGSVPKHLAPRSPPIYARLHVKEIYRKAQKSDPYTKGLVNIYMRLITRVLLAVGFLWTLSLPIQVLSPVVKEKYFWSRCKSPNKGNQIKYVCLALQRRTVLSCFWSDCHYWDTKQKCSGRLSRTILRTISKTPLMIFPFLFSLIRSAERLYPAWTLTVVNFLTITMTLKPNTSFSNH